MENENKKEEKFVPHAISNATFGHYREEQEKIAHAKDILTKAGYYVGNLYQIEDVQVYFDCTDNEAMDVLDSAMDNEGTAEQVWTAIREIGDMMGLKEKED